MVYGLRGNIYARRMRGSTLRPSATLPPRVEPTIGMVIEAASVPAAVSQLPTVSRPGKVRVNSSFVTKSAVAGSSPTWRVSGPDRRLGTHGSQGRHRTGYKQIQPVSSLRRYCHRGGRVLAPEQKTFIGCSPFRDAPGTKQNPPRQHEGFREFCLGSTQLPNIERSAFTPPWHLRVRWPDVGARPASSLKLALGQHCDDR